MPYGGCAFYNCGEHSGRSQPHKHLQVRQQLETVHTGHAPVTICHEGVLHIATEHGWPHACQLYTCGCKLCCTDPCHQQMSDFHEQLLPLPWVLTF